MSTNEFATSVVVLLSVMAVISAVEVIVPLFPRRAVRGRTTANLELTAIAFAINWALTSAAAVVSFAQGSGVMARLGMGMAAQIVTSVVVLDFFYGYLAHVALHLIPSLWRV